MKNVSGAFNQAINFLKEVKVELTRVEWPTTREFIGSTIVTLVLVLFFAVFVFMMDWAVNFAIQRVL